jgi:hypothetical protein
MDGGLDETQIAIAQTDAEAGLNRYQLLFP